MNTLIPALAVGAGGFVGALLRYGVGALAQRQSALLTLGTLWSNLLGCLLLGAIIAWATETQSMSPNIRLFLATGLCGGFTTMSTFTGELFHLLHDADFGAAALYLAVTLGGCLLMLAAGMLLVRLVLRVQG